MRAFGSAVIVLGLLIGAYIFAMQKQARDVEAFCAAVPVGSPGEAMFEAAERYSGDLMGGDRLRDTDKPQSFIYCAPMTMCDVSCNVEVTKGVVTKSDFWSL